MSGRSSFCDKIKGLWYIFDKILEMNRDAELIYLQDKWRSLESKEICPKLQGESLKETFLFSEARGWEKAEASFFFFFPL